MNRYYTAAAALLVLVGLAHSVMGERLIFRRMRRDGMVPTNGGTVLREPHVRILWAAWHFQTALGWSLAAILGWLALPSTVAPSWIVQAIVAAMLAGSLMVLVGTKGKHLGWVGLLGVAVLATLGLYA